MLVLWLPFVEGQWGWPKIKDFSLYGVGYTVQQPPFSWQGFFDLSYQDAMDIHAKEHIGYRALLVRLYNQADYSLFGLLRSGIVHGKGAYLFGGDYIREYQGLDCLPDSTWASRTQRLRAWQDTLAQKGVTLIYCVAPGKASYAAEMLPDAAVAQCHPVNNYKLLRRHLAGAGCRYIDFHAWFDTLRGKEQEKLFPDNGTHWSVYGGSLALDSLMGYMAQERHITLRSYHKKKGPRMHPNKWLDTDLRDMTNLLFEFHVDSVSYPEYSFDTNSIGCYKPKVLFISDSYIYPIVYAADLYQVFDSSSRIWDYNTTVYDMHGDKTGEQVDASTIDKYDFVILMNTEKNHGKFDYGAMDAYAKTRQ